MASKKQWVEHGLKRKLGEMKPHPRNSRTHSDQQVEQIIASMGEFDWTIPILLDEKGTILAGHGRQLAGLKKHGPDFEAPISVAHGWSETKKRGYVIADNRLTELGGWNQELLRGEMMELQSAFPDLAPLGYTRLELGELLRVARPWSADPDDIPDAPEVPTSRLGDIWMLGDHRLICGDSTDREVVTALLSGARPHLMVTDPPYGVEYDPNWRNKAARNSEGMGNRALGAGAVGKVLNDDRADWREAWALFRGDVAYVWCASLHNHEVAESLIASGFELRSQIIWDKTRLIIGRSDYHWQHEPCWYVVKKGSKGHWAGDRKQTTVWAIPHQRSETGHGTQKPVECMRRPIENNSKPGDAVYDPFVGSGTTIIAAEMTGRRAYAVELNPAYVDVVVRRWQEYTGKEAYLEPDGLSFADVTADRAVTPQQ